MKLDNFIQEEFVFENDGDKFDLGQGEAHNSESSTENMVLIKYQICHETAWQNLIFFSLLITRIILFKFVAPRTKNSSGSTSTPSKRS